MCRTSQALQFDQIERDHQRGLPDVQYIETNQMNNVETNQMHQNIETNQTENLEKTLLLLKIQAAGGHLRPGKDLFRPLLSHFSAAAKVYNQLLYQQHPPNSRLLVQNICKICVQMIHSGKIKYTYEKKKRKKLNFLREGVATC